MYVGDVSWWIMGLFACDAFHENVHMQRGPLSNLNTCPSVWWTGPFALKISFLLNALRCIACHLCSRQPKAACLVINSQLYLINCLNGLVCTWSTLHCEGAVKALMAASLVKSQAVYMKPACAKHTTLKPLCLGVKQHLGKHKLVFMWLSLSKQWFCETRG